MAQDFKLVSQRKWNKGLQATYSPFSEPDGMLKRLSNLIYDRRGGLRVVDGSLIVTKQNGALQSNSAPILDLALYNTPVNTKYYMGIQKTGAALAAPYGLNVHVADCSNLAITSIVRASGVTTVTFTPSTLSDASSAFGMSFIVGTITVSGTINFNRTFDASICSNAADNYGYKISYPDPGSDTSETAGLIGLTTGVAPGTYTFDVTASDGAGGETLGTGSPVTVTVASPNNLVYVEVFTPVGAVGLNVYVSGAATGRVNPSPSQPFIALPTNGNTTPPQIACYLGVLNAPGATPPSVGTATTCVLWRFDVPSYSTNLGTLPSAAVIAQTPPPGGGTGSGAIPAGQNPLLTPQGGQAGSLCPTPQLVPFQGNMIVACGNGYPPQYYTDGGTLQYIPNDFTAIYPDWVMNSAYNTGDNIVDSVSGGVFNCTQGGESGATRPTFNNTLNAGTADNTVVWECSATTSSGQALRGAAHAIVYGNSLWLGNTYPTSTSDNQDGPSCIKASNVGNFKQWNPINVAMVSKDDGDQITGMATFTVAEIGIEPTGNLVVFKNFATYQIVGIFGASDFAIQQAQTDMGCIASRSIQFLSGFGAIARLTHLGFALFDGVNDKLFSEEIRPYLFGDPNQPDIQSVDWSYIYFSKGSQSSNPPMYLCACPILTTKLTGVTAAGGTTGTAYTIYIKVTKLEDIGNGQYEEVAITNEFQVTSGNLSVAVQTPAAATGVAYRVYAGNSSGGENVFSQASSFISSTILPLSSMTAGTPSLGAGALTRIFAYDMVMKVWAVIDLPFPISVLKQIRTGGTQTLTLCGDWSDAAVRRLFAGDTTWDGAEIDWSMVAAEIFQGGGSGKVFYRKIVLRGSTQGAVTVKMAANIQGNTGTPQAAPQTVLGPSQFDARLDVMQQGENANVTVSGTGQCTIDSLDWYTKPKSPGAPVSAQR